MKILEEKSIEIVKTKKKGSFIYVLEIITIGGTKRWQLSSNWRGKISFPFSVKKKEMLEMFEIYSK